jgi:hypothetical protein
LHDGARKGIIRRHEIGAFAYRVLDVSYKSEIGMKVSIRGLVLAIAALLVGAEAKAGYTYSVDDGSSEEVRGFGPMPGFSVFWANEFTAVPGNNLITSISIAFGSPIQTGSTVVGTPVVLYLFRDANGLAIPDNPILLASATTTVQAPDSNTFITASIAPTLVSGNFFVGALVSGFPENGTFPMGFDTTSPQNHSYSAAFTSVVGLGLLPSLGYDPNNVFPRDENKFGPAHDGNFLLRANGAAVPEPSSFAMCGIAAVVGLAVTRVRRRRQV